MALHSLRYKNPSHTEDYTETRSGVVSYDGSPHLFHEWEFITMAKVESMEKKDLKQLTGKIVGSLRGDALTCAIELGRDKIFGSDGLKLLVDTIRKMLLPAKLAEAREVQKEKANSAAVKGSANLAKAKVARAWKSADVGLPS